MKELTIFTPTYNRAHLLPQLYNSLKNQTNKNFIWLIIDDGSTDNTKEVVDGFIKENKIEIDYHYKTNGGKNTAMDYSNQACKTEFITCVDSDDFLSEKTVEVLLEKIKLVSNVSDCVGLLGPKEPINKKDKNGKWNIPSGEYLFFRDLKNKYDFFGETFLVFKTDIIKNFTFPKIEGERFITETVFYNQFFYDYKLLTFDEKLYFFEYFEDGYSVDGLKLFFKNPKGYYYSIKSDLWHLIKYGGDLKSKLSAAARLYAWQKLFGYKNLFKDVYKPSLFYIIAGKILSVKFYGSYKKQYEEFKLKYDKNR